MKKEIQKFSHEQFGEIRICIVDNKEWFCLSDVCKALNLTNPSKVKKRLSGGGLTTIHTPFTNQYGVDFSNPITYIDEPNLYRCIFQSRKAEAEKFQNWVFDDVLPQLRKTGKYALRKEENNQTALSMIKMLQSPEAIYKLCQTVVDLGEENARLAPKAEYAEEVLMSPSCYTMTQIAKSLSMTVQELQRRLVDMHIIYRSPSRCWMLYAPYQKQGYEAHRTKTGENLFGDILWTNTYLVWTERGKAFIHSLFNNSKSIAHNEYLS